MLADEPTGALDTASSEQVMFLLKQLAQAGHTIILITHDSKVAQLADRIIHIRDGRLQADAVSPRKAACGLEINKNPGESLAALPAGFSQTQLKNQQQYQSQKQSQPQSQPQLQRKSQSQATPNGNVFRAELREALRNEVPVFTGTI
ncbi:hypothetical protein [Advenella sp. S44]|uniref:hypothetical protein n=1 Tax=Advenella sp. S44 TaxID=1982755 RepID=UPI00128FE75C